MTDDSYYCPVCQHPNGYHGSGTCSMPVLRGTHIPKGRNDTDGACERCNCIGPTPAWQERWGQPGKMHDGERFIWEWNEYENHVVYRGGPRPATLTDSLRAIEELVEEDDPYAAARAYEIAQQLQYQITLPNTVWVVFSEYLPDTRGERFSKRCVVWSAHELEDDAKLWHAAWVDKWAKQRTDYYVMYAQMDGVSPHYLRRPSMSVDLIRRAVNS